MEYKIVEHRYDDGTRRYSISLKHFLFWKPLRLYNSSSTTTLALFHTIEQAEDYAVAYIRGELSGKHTVKRGIV